MERFANAFGNEGGPQVEIHGYTDRGPGRSSVMPREEFCH
jgi:hypothetical protein